MNETYTTLIGNLVADPICGPVPPGSRPYTRLRLAVTERSYNPDLGKSVDGRTSFYQATAWGYLALNAAECLRKGERVIVHGKLSVRQYLTKENEPRTSVEVEALAVGHDLTFGQSRFRKVLHTVPVADDTDAGGDHAGPRSVGELDGAGAASAPSEGADLPGAEPDDDEPIEREPVGEYVEVDGRLIDRDGAPVPAA